MVVYDPLGTTVQARYTNDATLWGAETPPWTDDQHILDDPPPKFRMKPAGQGTDRGKVVDLVWRSTPALMPAVVPRSVVHWYEEDATSVVARGKAVVTICPSADSVGAGPDDRGADALEQYQAEGLELLLKGSVIDTPFVVEPGGLGEQVYTIAYEFASRYAHPAITVDVANFSGDIDDRLTIAFAPEQNLADFFDGLVQQFPAYEWWVDRLGELHFEEIV